MLALVEGVVATVERLLALHDAVLEGAELALALLLLRLGRLLVLDDLFLCLEQRFLFERLCRALRIADHLVRLKARRLDLRVGLAEAPVLRVAHGEHGNDGAHHEAADDADNDLHAKLLYTLHSS